MKAILTKPEPIWWDDIDEHGKKTRIRKLKLSMLVDIGDFADALSYDGATLYVYKEQPEIMAGGAVAIDPELKQGLMRVFQTGLDLLKQDTKGESNE